MGRVELNGEEIIHTLEPLRKKWQRIRYMEKLVSTVLVVCMIIFFGGAVCFPYIKKIYLLLPVACGLIIFSIILLNILGKNSHKRKQEYTDFYKRLISRPVLHSIFEKVTFEPHEGYPREDFKASELMWIFGSSYTYTSEDLIIGTYKGVNFRRADVKITHKSSDSTVVDVDGRLLEVVFPKKINGIVRVVKEGMVINLMGVNSPLVETEDADFNKKYNVYAEDKHSAFYLLTPQFMEYIKNLYSRDNQITITFDGEKLYFLQSGHGGIFEPPAGEFNAWDEVKKCREELSEIGEIIDVLQVENVADKGQIL